MHRLKEPFGKAGLIVAVVALVAALVGGAYAANTSGKRHHKKKNNAGLNGKQKKEVKKIAKGFQGAGPAGPQGPAGANGNDGQNGSNGAKGDKGDTGNTGSQGKQGIQGEPGDPWSAGGIIPSGTDVYGTMNISISGEYYQSVMSSISFPLPVKEAKEQAAYVLTASQLASNERGREELTPTYFNSCVVEGGNPDCVDTGCAGTADAPTAPPGQLCVYLKQEEGEFSQGVVMAEKDGEGAFTNSYGKYGTAIVPLEGSFSPEGSYYGYGTWALNAP